MKKLKSVLSFIFVLGIICLGFSFASNNYGSVNAFAYSSQIVLENSTFDMAGGTISNAIGDNGGAVYVGDGATFTMTGGKIKNCRATNGGAVYVADGGTFNFAGGTIENCVADLGGAVYVASGGTFNYENNADGFSGCGEDEDLHIYAEEGATVIGAGTPINIYVDGTLSKTINATGDSYTLNEADMPLDYEHCCGYFYDEILMTTIKNDTIDLTSAGEEITFAPRTASASSEGVNIYTRTATDSSYFTFEKNTTTGFYDIVGTTIESGDVVLPKEYQGVQVGIGITDVMYEPGVNEPVFYDKNISSIILPSGLTELINRVFYYCHLLGGELIIPDSVTSIGNYAFQYCRGLTSVTIGDSVTSIGNSAFSSCSVLTSVTIGDSVTSIGDYAFYDCSGLTEVKVTSGNTTYEDRGKNAIIEKSTNTIIQGFNCTDLSVLEEVTIIGNSAFAGCSGLTGSVTILDSVTSIGNYAFNGCSGLTSVYIPSSVTTISASSWSNAPFSYCSSNLKIYTDVANASSKPSGWGTYWNYYDSSNQLQVVYGCSLDSEGNIVTPPTINFYVDGVYHSSIAKAETSYTVQESEMPLDYEHCCGYFLDEGLTTTIKNNTIDLSNGDVNLYTRTATDSSYFTFEKNTTTGFYDIVGTTIESGDVVLPKEYQGVQVGIGITDVMYEPGVNEPVFYDKNISSIILPSGLTELINRVFYYCHLLGGELIIPDSVTRIGDRAFSYCRGLTSVTIGDSVTSIGDSAFYACSGLTSVTIGDSVTSIGYYTFGDCRGLTSVTIGDSVTSIGEYAFYNCVGLTSVTIGDSVTSIGNYAFQDCSGLTSVTIPDSVISIGGYAFDSCSRLTSVTIPDSVTSIGECAFRFCSGLTSVTIPDSVTSIGNGAFSSCSGLTSVIIPNSVTSINGAFSHCSGLTSVYIPSTVTTISASSYSSSPFYCCSSNLKIYTDVANASSKPSGWGTYWNYYDSSNQLQVVYGCSLDSEGNIVTPPTINFYVDGVYHSSITKAGTSYTVQESDMPLDYESCCGYFLDEGLTTTIKNNTIDLSNGDINLYTKTANCPSDYFTYNLDSTTNTYWITPKRSGQGGSNDFISKTKRMTVTATNHYVIPKEYLGLPIVEVKGGPAEVTLPTYSSVTLCDNITSIGDYAFNRAGTLNAVNVHDGITNIGVSAFYSCRLLSGRLIIPNSVTSIGGSAFSFCSGLTSVTIPDSVTIIGSSVFSFCSGLTSVIIPDSVTSIGYWAFESCSGLTSVYIPSTVTTISAPDYYDVPFYQCSSSLVIYTDVANASSKPSGWGTYWNYYGDGLTLTVKYGYSLAQYKAEVGLTFASITNNESVQVGLEVDYKESLEIGACNKFLQEEVILNKQEEISIIDKKKIA